MDCLLRAFSECKWCHLTSLFLLIKSEGCFYESPEEAKIANCFLD